MNDWNEQPEKELRRGRSRGVVSTGYSVRWSRGRYPPSSACVQQSRASQIMSFWVCFLDQSFIRWTWSITGCWRLNSLSHHSLPQGWGRGLKISDPLIMCLDFLVISPPFGKYLPSISLHYQHTWIFTLTYITQWISRILEYWLRKQRQAKHNSFILLQIVISIITLPYIRLCLSRLKEELSNWHWDGLYVLRAKNGPIWQQVRKQQPQSCISKEVLWTHI